MQEFLFIDDVGSVGDPGFVVFLPDALDHVDRLFLDQAHLHDFPEFAGARVVESKRAFAAKCQISLHWLSSSNIIMIMLFNSK